MESIGNEKLFVFMRLLKSGLDSLFWAKFVVSPLRDGW